MMMKIHTLTKRPDIRFPCGRNEDLTLLNMRETVYNSKFNISITAEGIVEPRTVIV